MKSSDLRGYAKAIGGSLAIVAAIVMYEELSAPPEPVVQELTHQPEYIQEQEKLAQARERGLKSNQDTDEARLKREEARLKQLELDRAHEAARLEFEEDEQELAEAKRKLELAKSNRLHPDELQQTKEALDAIVTARQAEVDELERRAAAAHEELRQSEARQQRLEAQLREIERSRSVNKLQARTDEEKAAHEAFDREAEERHRELKRQLDEEREKMAPRPPKDVPTS